MTSKKLVCSLMTLASLALVPACSSDDPDAAGNANIVDVSVSSNQFSPASVTVKVGQTVRWTWAGGTHNVVSGASCGDRDDAFSSGAPRSGGSFEKLFDKAGTFNYYCEPHCDMGMKGVVIVE